MISILTPKLSQHTPPIMMLLRIPVGPLNTVASQCLAFLSSSDHILKPSCQSHYHTYALWWESSGGDNPRGPSLFISRRHQFLNYRPPRDSAPGTSLSAPTLLHIRLILFSTSTPNILPSQPPLAGCKLMVLHLLLTALPSALIQIPTPNHTPSLTSSNCKLTPALGLCASPLEARCRRIKYRATLATL